MTGVAKSSHGAGLGFWTGILGKEEEEGAMSKVSTFRAHMKKELALL